MGAEAKRPVKTIFSVVIPAYNAERTIEACLASVLAQTLAPLQVLVIDDASGDGTEKAIRGWDGAFAAKGIRFQYFRLPGNSGPSAARNKGMSETQGSHVAFLDADDTWAPDKLAIIDNFARDSDVGLICHDYTDGRGDSASSNEAHHEASPLSIYEMLLRNPVQTSCAVVRNKPNLRFDEAMRHCEDYDLWMRVAEHSSVLRLIGDPLARLNRPQLSAGGLSGNTLLMRAGELRVYINFCRRNLLVRVWLLPWLVVFSLVKHAYSWFRRSRR